MLAKCWVWENPTEAYPYDYSLHAEDQDTTTFFANVMSRQSEFVGDAPWIRATKRPYWCEIDRATFAKIVNARTHGSQFEKNGIFCKGTPPESISEKPTTVRPY